jgi:uncharacterized protein YndB with AHSA1/START domain
MSKNRIGNFTKLYRLDLDRVYESSVNEVWDAITKSEMVSAWMEYPVTVDLRVGGEYRHDFKASGIQKGTICRLEPHKCIAYTWGDSLVKWELEELEGTTRAHFSHIGLTKDDAIELGAGWHDFIDYLEPFLRKQPFPRNTHTEIQAQYRAAVDKISSSQTI